jgi:hypothetical protein
MCSSPESTTALTAASFMLSLSVLTDIDKGERHSMFVDPKTAPLLQKD